MGWLIFMGGVISWANEWEDYSNYFGGRGGDFQELGPAHFLAFYGWPWNCHGGAYGCGL